MRLVSSWTAGPRKGPWFDRLGAGGLAYGMIVRVDRPWDSPVEVGVGGARVLVGLTAPSALAVYQQHADVVEHFDEADGPAGYAFVAVNDGGPWPQLVVTQRFQPAGAGFAPGVLLVPEQRQLFIGAGTRLLAYHARSGRWRRDWLDQAEGGFWGWCRHGDVVVMSAELELAAWTTQGRKLWTTFVEPPWSYRVGDGHVELDVMGEPSRFDLRTGARPAPSAPPS